MWKKCDVAATKKNTFTHPPSLYACVEQDEYINEAQNKFDVKILKIDRTRAVAV